jgi:putative transposase
LIDLEPIEHRDEYVGRRIGRGLFKSKEGSIIHADMNGRGKIMVKAVPGCFTTNGREGFVGSKEHSERILSLQTSFIVL